MKMSLPGNGIFVVKGEMSTLMTAMRRGARWSAHSHQEEDNLLMKSFQELKEVLNTVDDLRLVQSHTFLAPFLEVIRSGETTGPVTSLALSAINKFLSYGFIDPTHASVPRTVHDIADAVTHARFVGTDQSSDGVVLMRILQVLRTLTLAPEGATLTNESLCEIMLSCFRICFETRLNELLRRTAEHYLKDMVHLVFMRLPQFSEDLRAVKQFKMRPGAIEQTRTKRKRSFKLKRDDFEVENREKTASTPPGENIVDMQGQISQIPAIIDAGDGPPQSPENDENHDQVIMDDNPEEYVNQRGIRFTPQIQEEMVLIPYGLACVRELFIFLISLCNPNDKQNTEGMVHLGLTLLIVAFEVGADSIGKYGPLLILVRDDLCRNLFSLLNSERLSLFAADLQVCFLMFEAQRTLLKFQLELYLSKLIDIIVVDSGKVTYEHKELALDNVLQLWRIPGLVTELYLNYDCNLYCTNLYEDLTKLLAKNAFSATSGVYHTHLLSLDALLTVIQSIESHFQEGKSDCSSSGVVIDGYSDGVEIQKIIGTNLDDNNGRLKKSENVPSKDELLARKNIKRLLPQGTEYFNHKPKKGIQFLQEHGVLKSELDPHEVALFLRENTSLDKKMIGEYVSNRHNLDILDAFVKTFDFENSRLDEALRQYLETFRLPGEAPLISLLLENFAQHWHKSNGEPFADTDSAFTLAYAIIMLNVDQHNLNAKKQKTPMSLAAFKKNVSGVNGGDDFDPDMLEEIYNAIKNEEIVMPAEHTGLVRENYLWKVLLRKSNSKDGLYYHVDSGQFDFELFSLIWGPIVAALSFVFDKSDDPTIYTRALLGFRKCANISGHYQLCANLDMLVATLAKFTTFPQNPNRNIFNVTVTFGGNVKARLALKTLLELCHSHGDYVRDGWKNILELLLSLYRLNLLPKVLVEAEDFIESNRRISLVYADVENAQKQESGLFSSLYSYMLLSSENLSKTPTAEEQQLIDVAKDTIRECNLELVISESKFLHDDALKKLITTLIELSRGPDVQKNLGYNYNENVAVFFLELLIKIVIQNRDRVMTIWQNVRDHIYILVMNSCLFDYQFLLERSVIGLLRIAIRLMRNEEMSAIVLQSMSMLLMLKSTTLSRISRQISYGLYELLTTTSQNIRTKNDWTIIFMLLECVGAGAQPPKPIVSEDRTKSDDEMSSLRDDDDGGAATTDRGYTSDSELTNNNNSKKSPIRFVENNYSRPLSPPPNSGWILVGSERQDNHELSPAVGRTASLVHNLGPHDPWSLLKCCESLKHVVELVNKITPSNFDDCVHCIRTFVEASLNGTQKSRKVNRCESSSAASSEHSDDDSFAVSPEGYRHISITLIHLMHTLYTRIAHIFKSCVTDVSLWSEGWCPLLQGLARLCCDVRHDVRMEAFKYLQMALLFHDLQMLTGPEWEACFQRVLFPLSNHLLQNFASNDRVLVEKTRLRVAPILSKVFLLHLPSLLSLPTFSNLWLTILDFMGRYMHADGSDRLLELIQEILKNMFLVVNAAKVFDNLDGSKSDLWTATWHRIDRFSPGNEDFFEELKKYLEKLSKDDGSAEEELEQKSPTKSIILQPPAPPNNNNINHSQVSSPLFTHLGQMVSTPIPPLYSKPRVVPNSTLQTGMPFLYSKNEQHTFPILFSPEVAKNPIEQQVQPQRPVSLFMEYVHNPYNLDVINKNNEEMKNNASNYFQSENYFSTGDFIPPGSEILFGNENATSSTNIPESKVTSSCSPSGSGADV